MAQRKENLISFTSWLNEQCSIWGEINKSLRTHNTYAKLAVNLNCFGSPQNFPKQTTSTPQWLQLIYRKIQLDKTTTELDIKLLGKTSYTTHRIISNTTIIKMFCVINSYHRHHHNWWVVIRHHSPYTPEKNSALHWVSWMTILQTISVHDHTLLAPILGFNSKSTKKADEVSDRSFTTVCPMQWIAFRGKSMEDTQKHKSFANTKAIYHDGVWQCPT